MPKEAHAKRSAYQNEDMQKKGHVEMSTCRKEHILVKQQFSSWFRVH